MRNGNIPWKTILIAALVLVLYPLCFFGGCMFAVIKAMSMSGGVVITDGLLAKNFIEVGSNVHLALVSTNGETPGSIVVEFDDADSGSMIKSETVNVETSTNGSPYFQFTFPKEFTDSSSKQITATIRRN